MLKASAFVASLCASAGLIVAGVWLLSQSAAFMVAGVLVAAISFLLWSETG